MQRKLTFIGLMIIFLINALSASAGDIPTDIPVISQRFENGEMIYRKDNGDIYVISSASGTWWLFESASYGTMPANQASPPSERYAPQNGFGRIWANNATIQDELGWAVLPEIAFVMNIQTTDTGNLYFTRLNGIRLHLRPGGSWRVLDSSSDSKAIISEFSVSPTDVQSGEAISIRYESSGSDFVQIAIIDADDSNYNTDAFFELHEPSGQLEWLIPETVEGEVEVTINLVDYYRGGDLLHRCYGCLNYLASGSILISVYHNSDFSNETYAAYQQYEHGFMLWREDTGGVQIFYQNSGTWQLIPEHMYKNNSGYLETAPEGCIVPVNAFGKIWHSNFDIQVDLGCAIAEEIGYTLTIDGDGLGNFEYSLPDNRSITLTANSWE